jgi:hypothetical protein
MATAGATRTYPSQVIPVDPTDANFEADFRTNTESLMTAVKDSDDEISVARVGSTSYSSLGARLTALEGTAGVAASFWTIDGNASGSAGNTYITVTGNQTALYVVNRPIRIIGSAGTFYTYVGSSAYTSSTRVNLVTSAGVAYTLSGTFTSFSYATQEFNQLYQVSMTQLAPATTSSLNGTAVAMAIALGG